MEHTTSCNFFRWIAQGIRITPACKDWTFGIVVKVYHIQWNVILNIDPAFFVMTTFLNRLFGFVNLNLILLNHFTVVSLMFLNHSIHLSVFNSLICVENFRADIGLFRLHREYWQLGNFSLWWSLWLFILSLFYFCFWKFRFHHLGYRSPKILISSSLSWLNAVIWWSTSDF